jgi:SAM-dependent methyltransferase
VLADSHGPEISDRIIAFDPRTLRRLPVSKRAVLEAFLAEGNRRAARIVERIPEREGFLEEAAVDRLLVSAHREIQRLSEEFQHGRRVLELLSVLLEVLRPGAPRPLRVVDLGCGSGYVVRWLAAHSRWDDVELWGADYNATLIAEARRLAEAERLPCRFAVANAFQLEQPGTVILSTGVIHHFRGEGLVELFRQHEQPAVRAFVHFDFQPSAMAAVGAWVFHLARMREPLSLHDGVLSAARAHPGEVLQDAARRGAPGFASSLYGQRWAGPLPRAFQAILGVRPELREPFVQALGARASRLAGFP